MLGEWERLLEEAKSSLRLEPVHQVTVDQEVGFSETLSEQVVWEQSRVGMNPGKQLGSLWFLRTHRVGTGHSACWAAGNQGG